MERKSLMCTRFYILPGSPDLEYIMAAARKSPLLRRFVRRRQMELLQKKGFPDTGGAGNAAVQTDLFSTSAAGAGSSQHNSGDSDGILKTSGEIRPTDIVPVLAPDKGGNAAVYPMQWGFRLPAGNGQRAGQAQKGMLLVNARVETAAEKVTFRDAWASRRCIFIGLSRKTRRSVISCHGRSLSPFSFGILERASEDLFHHLALRTLPD